MPRRGAPLRAPPRRRHPRARRSADGQIEAGGAQLELLQVQLPGTVVKLLNLETDTRTEQALPIHNTSTLNIAGMHSARRIFDM